MKTAFDGISGLYMADYSIQSLRLPQNKPSKLKSKQKKQD